MGVYASIVGQELLRLAPGVITILKAGLCGAIVVLRGETGPWVNIADSEDYRSFQHGDPNDEDVTAIVWITCPRVGLRYFCVGSLGAHVCYVGAL